MLNNTHRYLHGQKEWATVIPHGRAAASRASSLLCSAADRLKSTGPSQQRTGRQKKQAGAKQEGPPPDTAPQTRLGSGTPSFWLSHAVSSTRSRPVAPHLLTKLVSRSQGALTLQRDSGTTHTQTVWGTTGSLTEEKQLLLCLAQKRKMNRATSTLNWIQDRERMTLQSTGEILPKMLRRRVGERNTSVPNVDKPLLSK